ncbi:hypothetical protein [Dactylosporangium sp. NPDC005555]|uniref:hypothetical protein n=1 Tax=Dactylosporangium sp. NPDC005555 TaxID=3154889 RepID=UPI0033A18A66
MLAHRQLRAGVGQFAADDDPGAVGVGGGVDEVGDPADFGVVARIGVLVESRDP